MADDNEEHATRLLFKMVVHRSVEGPRTEISSETTLTYEIDDVERRLLLIFVRELIVDLSEGGDALDVDCHVSTNLVDIVRSLIVNMYVEWMTVAIKEDSAEGRPDPLNPNDWKVYVGLTHDDPDNGELGFLVSIVPIKPRARGFSEG